MTIAAHTQLLDTFPLVRSQNVEDARERIGRFFSPHRLELPGKPGQRDVAHNQGRLARVSLNVAHYGAPVLSDPGPRRDFYMVQLPLSGSAQLACGTESVSVDPGGLSVLQPHIKNRMLWSADCTMLLP